MLNQFYPQPNSRESFTEQWEHLLTKTVYYFLYAPRFLMKSNYSVTYSLLACYAKTKLSFNK